MSAKYRMTQIAVMDDNTYCGDFSMDEYEGQGIKLYLTLPTGRTYEYYLGNRKGDLAIVRRAWGGDWEFIDSIPSYGDDIPVKARHIGQGKLKIFFESFVADSGMSMQPTMTVDLS